MRDEQKTKAKLLRELNSLRNRVTELTQAQEKLKQYRFIVEAVHDAIFFKDLESRYIVANNKTLEAFGLSREQVIGKNDYEIMANQDEAKKNIEDDNLVFKTGKLTKITKRMTGADGKERWFQAIKAPQFDDEGKIIGLIGIARDITERKKADKALRESEERYRDLIEKEKDIIYTLDEIGNITFASPAVETILGFRAGELIGKHFTILIPKEWQERTMADFNNLLKTGEITAETVLLDKRRQFHFVEYSSTVIKEGNKVVGTRGIVRDITERKKAEEALRDSEIKYRTLVENLPQKIFLKDKNSVYVSCNDNLARDLKIRSEEITGKTDYDFVPKALADKYRADDKRIIESGQTEAIEEKYIEDGQERIIHTVKTPVKDEQGNVIGVLGIFWDITERKKAEKQLKIMHAAIASSINAVAIADLEGNLTYVNNSFIKMWGYENDKQILGKPAVEFWQMEDRALKIVELLRNRESWIGELTARRKDGSTFDVQLSASSVIDEEGELICIMGSFVDITRHKRAKEEIKKLSTAIEQSIDGIAIGDLEPKLVYVNHAFARMHGYTPEEMVGMPVAKLHNKEQMDEYKKAVEHLKTNGSWEGEIGHIRKDGTVFLTYMSVTLLKDDNGDPAGTLAVARDITESRQREMELDTYRQNMVRAEELATVGTLSATVAHELTQPLTVIALSIENSLAELEKVSCPSTVLKDLKEGQSEVSNITSVVNRFRNFARMSTKKTVSEVDFKAVTERIVKLLNESAWRAKVTLRTKGMDKLPLIYSYERDLEQLFFSLVENAIQAADGKKKRQVIISGDVKHENIELQFSDDCGGIAPENLDRIFEPFFTTKHADERTGLGLCVVERIVSQLGGEVHVESKLGKGSTFFITLPINRDGR